MEYTLENVTMSSIHLRVSISPKEFDEHIEKAYAKSSSSMNLAGFRRGKIPVKMIDMKIGRDRILNDAIRFAIPYFFEKVLIERGLFAIGNPTFRVDEYKDGQELKFETEVNVRPAIKLPDFAEIRLQVPSIQISEEELKDDFYETIKEEKIFQQGVFARDLLINKLLSELEIPLPEDLIQKVVDEHLSREAGHDLEGHRIEVENEIRLSLKTDYLLDVISRANRIEINDSEINDYLVKAAQRFSLSPQDLANQLERDGQMQSLMAEVARSKALALALSQISIVDTDGQAIHL